MVYFLRSSKYWSNHCKSNKLLKVKRKICIFLYMRRIVLFSTPELNDKFPEILTLIFPSEISTKKALFMPSQGVSNTQQKFFDEWNGYAEEYNIQLEYIDNTAANKRKEIKKLNRSNILIISGGNPFTLLNNLRKSGLDKAIVKFTRKKEFILVGYSAGALILTPSLIIAKIISENDPDKMKYLSQIDLHNLNGLGIVEFEIIPHYSKVKHEKIIRQYVEQNNRVVKTIADDEYIVINY